MNDAPFSPPRFRSAAVALLSLGLVLTAWSTAQAQDAIVPTVLPSFDGVDGSSPDQLVEGSDGNFYGAHFLRRVRLRRQG